MELKNSTDWENHFLRRMVSWCCKQLGLKQRRIREAKFRNKKSGLFSGLASGGRRIVVTIGPAHSFPWNEKVPAVGLSLYTGTLRNYADRLECLIGITAHELRHLLAYQEGERTRRRNSYGSSERATEHDAQKVLAAFRQNREALVAEWSEVKKDFPAKMNRREVNELKACEALKKWERKLQLAKTKVAKYKAKVRRYEKIAASKSQGKE